MNAFGKVRCISTLTMLSFLSTFLCAAGNNSPDERKVVDAMSSLFNALSHNDVTQFHQIACPALCVPVVHLPLLAAFLPTAP